MKTKIEQFPATNSNPVLSIAVDGTVLYSNEAAEPLLNEWDVKVGEKLASNIGDIVQRVLSHNNSEKIEVRAGNRIYSIAFHLLPEEECVNIYGFDISDQKELEEENHALKDEIQSLIARLEEPEELRRAILEGDLDALVMPGSEEDLSVFILGSADSAFRTLIETANEDMVIVDAELKITYAGKRLTNKMGYSQGELIDRSWLDFVDEENKAVAKLHMGQSRLGIDESYELKLIRNNSSPYWVLISAKPLFDENGKFKGTLAMLTDITEHKKAEQKIRRYNRILDGINRIHSNGMQAKTEEELGNKCLSIALELTGSLMGFVGLVGDNGFLHDIAINMGGWNQCLMHDNTGHHLPPENYFVRSLYGNIIDNGKGFFTNNPHLHPDSIGLPYGHPPITSFLGVPLVLDGKTIGLIAVVDREGGYSYEYQEDLEAITPEVIQALQRIWSEKALSEAYENLQVHSEELQAQSEELYVQSVELKEANEALRESEERFRTMANAIPQLAWIAHADGYIHWYNERWYAYTGTTPEQMEGWGWQSVHDPEVLPKVLEQWKCSIATGQMFDMEFPLRGADGIFRPFLTRIFPLKDAQGNILQWFGTNTDVTERKQMEDKLKQSVKQYQTLGDTIPYGVWITDAEGYCTYASDSFLELLGMSLEQVQKFGWMDRLPPEDVQPTTDHWLHCVQTGEDFEHEHFFRAKDGSYRNVLAIGRPVRDDAGRITEWISLNLDVTERRHMEESLKIARDTLEEKVKERTAELEKAYESLKESEERLAEAQKTAHVGSFDWNIATNEEYWSDELYRIFGLDPQFELNHNKFLNRIHSEDLEYVNHAINEALSGKPYNIDYRIILPDGEERVIYSQGGVIFDEKNTPIRMRGIVQDITERKKAEESLARIEIARKQEIHHRIKNNLQVISSLLDLQAEKFSGKKNIKDSEVLEAFRESQDRVISMALIHEELHKGGEIDTVNFLQYIEELANNLLLSYRIGNSGIKLNTDVEKDIFFDMDTSVPLGMIVNELVSNSLKHAFPARDKGEIQIKLHREESEDSKSTSFILNISDNGIGIPENIDIEDLESLGLQLVTSLVDQLDGELELKKNNGTEFIIRFVVRGNKDQALS